MFRDDFVWGVASSAYQIEGRDANDGAGAMIWDKFIAEGGTKDGYGAEVACDHMHRYKDDFALMMWWFENHDEKTDSGNEKEWNRAVSDHVSLGVSPGITGQGRLAE